VIHPRYPLKLQNRQFKQGKIIRFIPNDDKNDDCDGDGGGADDGDGEDDDDDDEEEEEEEEDDRAAIKHWIEFNLVEYNHQTIVPLHETM
jgi:hypothetical protein